MGPEPEAQWEAAVPDMADFNASLEASLSDAGGIIILWGVTPTLLTVCVAGRVQLGGSHARGGRGIPPILPYVIVAGQVRVAAAGWRLG